jgi:ferric-dicitrate binding protein FerR (iron transport regulator)
MNNFFSTKATVGGVLALALFSSPAWAAENTARITSLKGTVMYGEAGSAPSLPARSGLTLRQGATVKTAAASMAELALGQGIGDVRVTENTTLTLTQLMFAADETATTLSLPEGRIVGTVDKLSATSKYEIKTPKATFGVRGTKYSISADGTATVADGSLIAVSTRPDGTTVTRVINAGETFNPNSGLVGPATSGELASAGGGSGVGGGDGLATPLANIGDPVLRLTDTPVSRFSPATAASIGGGDGGGDIGE